MAADPSLRDLIAAISPPWLAAGDGLVDASKRVGLTLMYVFGLVADMLVEHANEAVLAWMPTRTKTTTSLQYIGDDRRIPQGPNEAASSYGLRLRGAFDAWHFAGMPRGKLAQLLGFLSPATPRVQQVSHFADWYTYAAGADPTQPPTHLFVAPTNWDWDSISDPAHITRWWRFWVILDATGWTADAPPLGSKALGDKRYTLGFATPQGVFTRIKEIVQLWKRAGAYCDWVIVRTDLASPHFVSTAAPGDAANPDGRWGPWSKIVGGQRMPSRSPGARYIATTQEVV